MKKLLTMSYALLCVSVTACMGHHNDNINLTYSEDDQYYSMDAQFSKSKTRSVDEYMDERIGKNSHMSFVNSRIDGTIALDDHTTFYIKKATGSLEIKLDKNKNSNEAYHKIKSMCEGIKKVLTNK